MLTFLKAGFNKKIKLGCFFPDYCNANKTYLTDLLCLLKGKTKIS